VAKENGEFPPIFSGWFLRSAIEKMKKTEQNGFALILVIMAIFLIGVVMFVLTEDAKTILFQSDTAYLQAVERSLTASGLAWAEQSIKHENKETLYKAIEFDVTDLGFRDATLSVCINSASDEKARVEVKTSCSRGRRTREQASIYKAAITNKDHPNSPQI